MVYRGYITYNIPTIYFCHHFTTVVGGLIGTATKTKDGLLEKELYANRALGIQLSNNKWYKLGRFSINYTAMRFVGVEVVSGTIIDIYIYNSVNNIKYAGNKSSKMNLKMNNAGEIYAMSPSGISISANPCIGEQVGTTEPSGLTDIPVA